MTNLAGEIEKMKKEMNDLASEKDNPLNDPEIYECSCIIDKMIVELLKMNDVEKKRSS